MSKRLEKELGLVRQEFGEVEMAPDQTWLLIRHFPLLPGWNSQETEVLIPIPPSYPVTALDNFLTTNELRPLTGEVPGASTPNHSFNGKQWLQFSFHVEAGTWQPSANILEGHNILTFISGIKGRLQEAN